MKGKDKASQPTAFLGLGMFQPPPDPWVPVAQFWAEGDMTFDQIVVALDNGLKSVHVKIWGPKDRSPRDGRATEVDDSGIVRVEHPVRHGIVVLLKKVNGRLLGEFT